MTISTSSLKAREKFKDKIKWVSTNCLCCYKKLTGEVGPQLWNDPENYANEVMRCYTCKFSIQFDENGKIKQYFYNYNKDTDYGFEFNLLPQEIKVELRKKKNIYSGLKKDEMIEIMIKNKLMPEDMIDKLITFTLDEMPKDLEKFAERTIKLAPFS